MPDNNPKSKDNLIDLAAERQRMQGRSATLRGRKLTKTQKGPEKKSPKSSSSVRWYHYLQLILFMALIAWLMRSCRF
jgi:hypothetical protein